jgi:hypothetical protein
VRENLSTRLLLPATVARLPYQRTTETLRPPRSSTGLQRIWWPLQKFWLN